MKKIILIFLSLSLYMSQAQAACDFIINIGDNKAKLVQKFTDPFPMFDNIFMLPIPSPQVCPNDNLDQDIAIEYIFIDDNLAAIRMVVFNDEKNNISNKLLLMNYAKKSQFTDTILCIGMSFKPESKISRIFLKNISKIYIVLKTLSIFELDKCFL